jgi:hypothetical protein
LKNDILKIIESDEPKIIQKYLEDYLILLENNIIEYTTEPIIQSTSCPSTGNIRRFEEQQGLNKRHKIIQDLKRRMLSAELEQYEQELTLFNSEIF